MPAQVPAPARDIIVAIDGGTAVQPLALIAQGRWADAIPAAPPQSQAWTRWRRDGASEPLTLGSVSGAPACWPVDARRGPAAAVERGLAANGPIRVEPARRVPASEAEWQPAQAVVRDLFARREREQRLSAAAVSGIPIVVEALFRSSGLPLPAVYYFEASKSIPDEARDVDPDDPRGTLRLTVAGWLRIAGARVDTLGTRAELYWEQVGARPITRGLVPLGIVSGPGSGTESGSVGWVMEEHDAGRTSFPVYDVSGPRVRMLLRRTAADCVMGPSR